MSLIIISYREKCKSAPVSFLFKEWLRCLSVFRNGCWVNAVLRQAVLLSIGSGGFFALLRNDSVERFLAAGGIDRSFEI